MNVNQQKNLQKIMLAFDKDYRLSEQRYDRQVELIDKYPGFINSSQLLTL